MPSRDRLVVPLPLDAVSTIRDSEWVSRMPLEDPSAIADGTDFITPFSTPFCAKTRASGAGE